MSSSNSVDGVLASTLSAAPLYTYKPLSPDGQEFRLVHILPGDWDAPVTCELHVVGAEEGNEDGKAGKEDEYQTLSYVWGDPDVTRPILVDGCRFEVTVNLWAALRRLRNRVGEGGVRRMWIDALCINQTDNEERTRQVMMMGRTYASCTEVIIWLGDGVGGVSSEPLGLQNGFSSQDPTQFQSKAQEDKYTVEEGTALFRSNLENGVYPKPLTTKSPDLAHSSVGNAFAVLHLLATDDHFTEMDIFINAGQRGERRDLQQRYKQSLRSLHEIMKQPYWNRIWVIQEAILPPAATVVCGSISVPWQLFVAASYHYTSHSTSCCHAQWVNVDWRTVFVDLSFTVRIVDLARSQRRNGNRVTLFWLLKQYFDREATDCRDKAYGLLGLVNEWGYMGPLVPDYEITARELYEGLTMRIIKETNILEVLMGQSLHHTAGDEEENEDGMPSWVADWGRVPDAREWDWEQGPWIMSDSYMASKNKPVVAEKLPDSTLRLRGVRVDTITAVGVLMTVEHQSIIFVPLEDVLALYGKSAITPESPYMSSITTTIEEAYFRTLRGDNTYHANGQYPDKYTRATPEDRRGYDLWRNGFKHSHIGEDGDRAAFRSFWKSTVEAVRNRRFFVTEKGYMGLGPKGTRAGDEVVVLEGARVPFVLRRDDFSTEKKETSDAVYTHLNLHSGNGHPTTSSNVTQSSTGNGQESKRLQTKRLFERFQAKLKLRNRPRRQPSQQLDLLSINNESTSGHEKEHSKRDGSEVKPLSPIFKLVGDSYVHGIMDGEIYDVIDVSGRLDNDLEKKSIKTKVKAVDIFLR
jgi:hypothetical protein